MRPNTEGITVAISSYFPVVANSSGGSDGGGRGGRGAGGTVDVLPTLRKVLLHAAVSYFVGPEVLTACPEFIEQYVVCLPLVRWKRVWLYRYRYVSDGGGGLCVLRIEAHEHLHHAFRVVLPVSTSC